LQGYDDTWTPPTKQRVIGYKKLPPGKYHFKTKASNDDGVWNETGRSIQIIIKPPFWKTWWFYSLCAGFLFLIVFGIFKYRIGQIRKEGQLKTDYEKKLAEVEMTSLRTQMNPHFLFNSLNSIKRYIVRNDAISASDYLTKFSRLVRLILHNSKRSRVPLEDELEALKLYVELESLRFEGKFTYQIEIAKNVNLSLIEIPPLILQPYVENAIWHGLMHKEGKGLLSIKIELAKQNDGNELLYCEIEDNGIGRERAAEYKSKSATTHKSMGMQITKDRLDISNVSVGIDSGVEIKDLKDEKTGMPKGTLVILKIAV
jgi:LytS/YehU family sensor histidine kinase